MFLKGIEKASILGNGASKKIESHCQRAKIYYQNRVLSKKEPRKSIFIILILCNYKRAIAWLNRSSRSQPCSLHKLLKNHFFPSSSRTSFWCFSSTIRISFFIIYNLRIVPVYDSTSPGKTEQVIQIITRDS